MRGLLVTVVGVEPWFFSLNHLKYIPRNEKNHFSPVEDKVVLPLNHPHQLSRPAGKIELPLCGDEYSFGIGEGF
jgi:hypothetical protein